VKHNFTCEISHVKNHMFQIHMFNFTHVKSCGIFVRGNITVYTRKYVHACRNPRLADKAIVFSELEVSKVVVMVTR
jgi:hypothetical protein